MNRLERLRGVVRPGLEPRVPSPGFRSPAPDRHCPGAESAAEILGGEWREADGRRFVTVDRTYLPGHRHGHVSVADGLPPSDRAWSRLSLLAGASCGGKLLFLDLETTGLAGGAGTQAFLVGCGWFDGGTFRTRQFLLASLAAEPAMLEAVAALASATDALVTYNGKSFDLPLIETRFLFHRLDTPFGGVPHLDMLHPARRLWRPAGAVEALDPGLPRAAGGCRLSVIEEAQCGYVRDGDVPGFEIPSRYFHFVRTGDARALAGVLEHNRLDLLSLALLTSRAAQLLEEGPAAARTARESLGLGRLFERGGLTAEAGECYARAAGLEQGGLEPTDAATRAEALRAFAALSRRERRHEEAARAWRALLEIPECAPLFRREATLALAVHHEHRLRDPLLARGFALESLRLQETAAHRQAVEHRLARLGRKLGEPAAHSQALF